MDLDSLKATWFINEASKLSPNNPQSNGYGFAAAVLVGVIVILLAYIVWKERGRDKHIRSLQSEREKYRTQYLDLLQTKFAEVYSTLDDISKSVDAFASNLRNEAKGDRDRINHIGEELARLKGQFEVILGQPKNRGTKT